MKKAPRILAMVLAGGRGERLFPLTAGRVKPAVPFGARYRLVDFCLSNLTHSGILSVYVLVQYRCQSLIEHVRVAWQAHGLVHEHFVTVVPPQMRTGEEWYRGTADAVSQNMDLIEAFKPDIVAVFGADHVYRMDVEPMWQRHLESQADVTVAAVPVPIESSSSYGVLETNAQGRIVQFVEKPSIRPRHMPGDPDRVLASMGNYLFKPSHLMEILSEDANRSTDHDFGKTILPALVEGSRVYAYDFSNQRIPGFQSHEELHYWRDIGTLPAYWAAHMDLLGAAPRFELLDPEWPIISAPYAGPPAGVYGGTIEDVLIGGGSRVKRSLIRRSVLGEHVQVEEGCDIEDSIILGRAVIRRGSRLRRAIVDDGMVLPPESHVDPQASASGIPGRYVDPTRTVVVASSGVPPVHDMAWRT